MTRKSSWKVSCWWFSVFGGSSPGGSPACPVSSRSAGLSAGSAVCWPLEGRRMNSGGASGASSIGAVEGTSIKPFASCRLGTSIGGVGCVGSNWILVGGSSDSAADDLDGAREGFIFSLNEEPRSSWTWGLPLGWKSGSAACSEYHARVASISTTVAGRNRHADGRGKGKPGLLVARWVLRAVVGGFLCDRDIMRMALPSTGCGNSYETRLDP